MPIALTRHEAAARAVADAIGVMTPNERTLERLAFEIRLANSIHETARLDPALDPETMLAAALKVSFALHGFVDTRQVMITRYSAAAGCVTFASLCVTADSAGVTAERRLHTAPVPLLAAGVWVPKDQVADAAEILRPFGEVRTFAVGFLQVELNLAQFEHEALA